MYVYVHNFLVKGYFLATENRYCSQDGHIAVNDLSSCIEAAYELKLKFKHQTEYDLPQGCYVYGDPVDGVIFDPRTTDSPYFLANAAQICKPRGKIYIILLLKVNYCLALLCSKLVINVC